MFTIALVNQKGGVGKSTTAVNLSAGLARLGKRVLLLDLDPQAHTTVALGLQPKKLEKTIYTLLAGQARAKDVIHPVSSRLSIIPASIDLAGGEAELAAQPRPHFILKHAMAEVIGSDYDYAIVDSPPQLGFLNVNSLAWVKEVYIPVTCEFYALHGLSLLMETVERIQQKLNPDLKISGVVACQYQPRRALTRDVLADLERHFPGRVCKTKIRVNVRLAEAPSHGMNIFDYAPDCNGATDYLNLAKEVLVRCGDEPTPIPALGLPAAEIVAPAAEVAPEPAAAVVEAPVPDPVVETPVAEPVVETPVAEPIAEAPAPEPVAEPVVETPIVSEPVVESPVAEPVVEAPVSEPVVEAPIPEPVVEAPVAEPVAEAPVAEPAPSIVEAPLFEAPAPAPSYVEGVEAVAITPESVVEAPVVEFVPVAAEPVVEAPVVAEPVFEAAPAAEPGPGSWGSPAETPADVPSPVVAIDSIVAEAMTSEAPVEEAPAPEPEPAATTVEAPAFDPYAEKPAEPTVTESRKEFVSPYSATPISELPQVMGRVDEPTPIPNWAAILPSAKNASMPFATRLAMAGLKPIVVAKPTGLTPLPEAPKKSLLGRLLPWRRS